jgi:hypothetical protein
MPILALTDKQEEQKARAAVQKAKRTQDRAAFFFIEPTTSGASLCVELFIRGIFVMDRPSG